MTPEWNSSVSRKIWPSVMEMDVRGDVGGHIARLRLDDGQCRQAAAAQLVGELGRAFQQTGVQIEDVARVSLTSRRTADQQRQGAVSRQRA